MKMHIMTEILGFLALQFPTFFFLCGKLEWKHFHCAITELLKICDNYIWNMQIRHL